MPTQINPIKYFTFTKEQATNFLAEIEKKRANNVLPEINFLDDKGKEIRSKKDRYECYTKSINLLKASEPYYYFTRMELFYDLTITKSVYSYPYEKIKNFLEDFFKEYDFENSEKNAHLVDIGKVEEAIKEKFNDLNNGNSKIDSSLRKNENAEQVIDRKPTDKALEQYDWILYTYGEKRINLPDGNTPTRVFYVKERPVQFQDKKIMLKNSDRAKIIFRDDNDRNRKGLVVEKSEKTYHGEYQVFNRKNESGETMIYIETESLKGENNRHYRLILTFGEEIDEIALGTFSLIKDSGTLLAGSALLVRKEKGYFEKNKCKFYPTFKNDANTIDSRPIRMLLEKRSRAYIKLPKVLDKYTLRNLELYLLEQKRNERKDYESREVIIHRKDAFVSIPLNCNGSEASNKYNGILKKAVQILKEQPYNLSEITYGTIKHEEHESSLKTSHKKNKKANHIQLESPGSREEYESNFDKIIQSNLVIFIFPEILFPYETEIKSSKKGSNGNIDNISTALMEMETKSSKESSNGNINNISTAFMELGFAIGLRKKILILTSEKVFKTFPSIIKKFAEGERQYAKIIKCNLENESELISSVTKNQAAILNFLDTHLDYEIIEGK